MQWIKIKKREGATRFVWRFAFWPITLCGITRWMEWCGITQRCWLVDDGFSSWLEWHNDHFGA